MWLHVPIKKPDYTIRYTIVGAIKRSDSDRDRVLLRIAISCRVGTTHQPLKALEGRKVYSNAESLSRQSPREGSSERIVSAIEIPIGESYIRCVI